MTVELPLWLQNAAYPARLDRQLFAVLFTPGVVDGDTDLAVSERAAGANMSVDVAAGQVVVEGTEQADQGSYLCRSTAVENRAVATADGAQERFDRVIARVADSNVSGLDDGWVVEVLTGTPGSGAPPAVPASAESLATVRVRVSAASVTAADVTDDRRQSGRQQIRIGTQADPLTTADRDAQATPDAGMLVFNLDTDELEAGDGAAWLPQARRDLTVATVGGSLRGYAEPYLDLGNVSGVVTLDFATHNVWRVNPTADVTIAFANLPGAGVAAAGTLIAANGDHALSWPAGTKHPSGSAPALSGETWLSIVALGSTVRAGAAWQAVA